MRRRKREFAGHGVDLAVIITPMLDMAFQLLAFFIITYHPAAHEGMVDGTLMPAAHGETPANSGHSSVHITVQATPDGQPKAVYLHTPTQTAAKLIAEISTPLEFDAALRLLATELASILAQPGEKYLPLAVQADRSLGFGHFALVQDVARASGFKAIEFRASR